ncbi:hypothetical protein Taro_049362 [Colocasia esculenta]|uniref:Thioredoxin domain-containing protein n=1 Tax=Colocasia esculenta TaxID=4460 RepID=A0A843XAK1_COLES|nr:hypothetical protein [Colocasia esculenta]
MVAVGSASASLGSCRVACPAVSESPRLSAVSGSLRCPAIRGLGADKGMILALPRRRVLPVVGAMKQASSSFEEMLKESDKPVLVDFYATWCGPCQYMVPVLDQVSDILQDKIQIVKIDTQKEKAIANKYRIEALPTFIIFRDGEPCDRFVSEYKHRLSSKPRHPLLPTCWKKKSAKQLKEVHHHLAPLQRLNWVVFINTGASKIR